MAKKLIPEELDALIQEYLTDGVLTEKERQVILKKAVAMGLDRDEVDLYLDAQVQKIDQATDAAVRKQKGKTCPYCGSPVPQLAEKCPECGQIITPEASKELQEILDNLEEALIDFKDRKNAERSKAAVERYARKAKLYYSNNPKIKLLLAEIENEVVATEKAVKAAERSDTMKAVISSKWFLCGIPIVLGIIILMNALGIETYDYDYLDNGEKTKKIILIIVGALLSLGGILGLVLSLLGEDYRDEFKDFLFSKKFWCILGVIIGICMIIFGYGGFKIGSDDPNAGAFVIAVVGLGIAFACGKGLSNDD